jgi:uncharacterized protein YebE (UPF0316 family)
MRTFKKIMAIVYIVAAVASAVMGVLDILPFWLAMAQVVVLGLIAGMRIQREWLAP